MERMLNELRMEMDQKYNMTDNDFENFVTRASAAAEEGEELDWSFVNSCGFVFAAFTTIGFGNMTPKTQAGKIITIPACIFGITITMLAFKTAGELLASCIKFCVIKTEKGLLKRVEIKHIMKKTFLISETVMIVLHVLVSISATFIENWSFLDSFYAWFVAFTTIGFGDYVPFDAAAKRADRGETGSHLVMFLLLYYLPYVTGLSLMSCLFTCLVDSVDYIRDFQDRFMDRCLNLFKRTRKRVCCKREENEVHCASLE
ncbi:potassium channel subfamily K member 3-like [Oculina patagonica]